jgi:hypothetical protein
VNDEMTVEQFDAGLRAMGGVVLDPAKPQAKPEPTLGDIGIMNRRDARRAGLYGPKRGMRGRMAIPKGRP